MLAFVPLMFVRMVLKVLPAWAPVMQQIMLGPCTVYVVYLLHYLEFAEISA